MVEANRITTPQIPQQVVVKAAMADTGLTWNKLKVFILVPLTGGNNPGEIARLFNAQTTAMIKRCGQVTLNDIYKYEQIVRQKLENGEPLISN